MYTEGTESLRGIERFIGMVTTSSIEKARIIARSDELMKKYIEDAKRAETNVLPYYYDLEVDHSAYYREEGWMACQKEERNKLLESIKKMCKTGLPIETILECFDLSEDETKKVKHDLVRL